MFNVFAHQGNVTIDQFLRWPEEKPYRELIRGSVRQKTMPDAWHSSLQTDISTALNIWSREPRTGRTLTEQRCVLAGDVVLPDVAWWPLATLPTLPDGAISVSPVLAVEILSRDDRYGDVQDKVVLYLSAGVTVVWIVDPRSRNVTVYRPASEPIVLAPPLVLTDDALPGFSLSLEALFASIPPREEPQPRIQPSA